MKVMTAMQQVRCCLLVEGAIRTVKITRPYLRLTCIFLVFRISFVLLCFNTMSNGLSTGIEAVVWINMGSIL